VRTLRIFGWLALSVCGCALSAFGQDSQSVAETARQARLQKQQKDAQARDAANPTDAQPTKPPHVITNDEIPEHVGSTLTAAHGQAGEPAYASPSNATRRNSADRWKSQIQGQKSAIAALQGQIKSLADSIHFPENCLPHTCAQRNERQLNKESRVDTLNHQLEQQQKRLEELQESARKDGFGSAVYDP
jgi:predicted RNase H-like nuclease (RuvC/YqgF family)